MNIDKEKILQVCTGVIIGLAIYGLLHLGFDIGTLISVAIR